MTRFLAALATYLLISSAATAQLCSFSISNPISFPTVSLISGSEQLTTATLNINCTGVLGTTVRICPNLGAGSGGGTSSAMRQMIGPGGTLNYQLYSNMARTTVWGSTSYASGPPTFDIGFGLSTSINTTRTIYGRVFANQTSQPATTYSSMFNGADIVFTYGTTLGTGSCPTILVPLTASPPPFEVRATAVNNCAVTSTDINFGTHGNLNSNIDATGQLSITCTAVTYSISLSAGNANTGPTARQMTSGASTVTYGLYQDAGHTLPWGDTIGTNTKAGTGNGSTQLVTVYARVPPQQTPVAGSYTDTIIVTVTY